MVLGWGKKVISQDSTYARATASKVLEFLCSNTPHNRADVFKYNIDVVRFVRHFVIFHGEKPMHDTMDPVCMF